MAPVHDMFQKKTDELFSDMPNAFSIADDILNATFDGQAKDHDVRLDTVLRVWRQANVMLNKDNCPFR